MVLEVLQNPGMVAQRQSMINELRETESFRTNTTDNLVNLPAAGPLNITPMQTAIANNQPVLMNNNDIHAHVEVEESLNIMDKEKELIIKALKKHKSKRKDAAMDLGISERTLYRKLKEYDIEEL